MIPVRNEKTGYRRVFRTFRFPSGLRFFWILPAGFLFFISGLSANTSRDLGMAPLQNSGNIEKWILFYSNIERSDRDLPPLLFDEMLRSTARWQAGYCAQIGYLNHFADVSSMRTTGERLLYFSGKEPRFWGENLVVVLRTNIAGKNFVMREDWFGKYRDFGSRQVYWRSERQVARAMVDKWMKSPLHRTNLLSRSFERLGPGVVASSYRKESAYYGAQVFSSGRGLTLRNFAIRKLGTVRGRREIHLKLFNRPGLRPVVFGYGRGRLIELEARTDRDGLIFQVPPDDEADMIYRIGAVDRLHGIYYPVRRAEWAPERFPY